MIVNIKDHQTELQLIYWLSPWRKHRPRSWTLFLGSIDQLRWSKLDPGRGNPPNYQIDIRSISTSWALYQCFRGWVRIRHLQRKVLQLLCWDIWESSYRLNRQIFTVISLPTMSESRNLLPVGDHRLEDFFRMQVSFC